MNSMERVLERVGWMVMWMVAVYFGGHLVAWWVR